MIGSVYIKDGNIHFYNEGKSFSGIGGLAYELAKPLLNFLCYEQERFDESFSAMIATFEIPGAEIGMHAPAFKSELKEQMTEMQIHEPYVFLYNQALINSIYNGHKPRKVFEDLSKDFRQTIAFAKHEIENLLVFHKKFPNVQPLEYIHMLDIVDDRDFGEHFFLEKPFKVFYGVTKEPEVAELYEIDSIRDLLRFEIIKMIENSIFIKKCKNCEQFFIPTRRQDAEYCDRIFDDTHRKCSEIGAMLRYEKKVAENPVWDAYKKAYRRFNSRTRTKKMTQSEFLQWSEQAAQKRDKCLAGDLSFEEFTAWLEQGRVRKPRNKKQQDTE
ncbi:hypothetical protein FACS1894188_11140 [Clostridia bacterium]|nr:hypothetical protein FACS1894188_11140 [Clostridia bacterium]